MVIQFYSGTHFSLWFVVRSFPLHGDDCGESPRFQLTTITGKHTRCQGYIHKSHIQSCMYRIASRHDLVYKGSLRLMHAPTHFGICSTGYFSSIPCIDNAWCRRKVKPLYSEFSSNLQ